MFLLLAEAFLSLLIGYSVWWYFLRRPKNIPPGPWGLPFIGYLPFMTMNPGKKFMELEPKYGPIISFDRGPMLCVMINDYDILKKAFNDDLYTGKPNGNTGQMFLQADKSFVHQDGQHWHEGRRFVLSMLRDFGMGKSSLEPRFLDEIAHFLDEARSHKGKPFDLEEILGLSIGNVNTLMQFGKRYDYDNAEKREFHHGLQKIFRESYILFILLPTFPWILKYGLHKYLPIYKTQAIFKDKQEKFLREIIEDHKRNYYDGKKDDFIDAYIAEREKRTKTNNNPEFFDDETLMTDLRMLALATGEGTAMALSWMFVFLMAHQDVQRKIQKEIDNVIGRNRQPAMSDKANMPYTEAFLLEVTRRGVISPISGERRVKEDTYLEGYFIPKDTQVFGNVWAIQHDEKAWPDPDTFRPERFLDTDGNVIRTDRLLFFSIGKRNCIGENLARMTMFLFLTSVLQNFTLLPPEGGHVTLDCDVSFGFLVKNYKVRAIERPNN